MNELLIKSQGHRIGYLPVLYRCVYPSCVGCIITTKNDKSQTLLNIDHAAVDKFPGALDNVLPDRRPFE